MAVIVNLHEPMRSATKPLFLLKTEVSAAGLAPSFALRLLHFVGGAFDAGFCAQICVWWHTAERVSVRQAGLGIFSSPGFLL